MIFPSTNPTYAPVTIVTGHFCHSRSLMLLAITHVLYPGHDTHQSSGIGTAPIQAPNNVPNAAP